MIELPRKSLPPLTKYGGTLVAITLLFGPVIVSLWMSSAAIKLLARPANQLRSLHRCRMAMGDLSVMCNVWEQLGNYECLYFLFHGLLDHVDGLGKIHPHLVVVDVDNGYGDLVLNH